MPLSTHDSVMNDFSALSKETSPLIQEKEHFKPAIMRWHI